MAKYICPFCSCPLVTWVATDSRLDKRHRFMYLELNWHLKECHRITPQGVKAVFDRIMDTGMVRIA